MFLYRFLSTHSFQHEQIKSSGLAFIATDSSSSMPPMEAYAEAMKKLEQLTFQAHKTTSIPLKTAYVSTSAQIHVDVRKKDTEGVEVKVGPGAVLVPETTGSGEKVFDNHDAEPMRCEVEIEQVGEDLWRVNVTPREDGKTS